MNTIIFIIMIGATLIIKDMKLNWKAEPIMMLGGSPIIVAVPPMLEANASDINIGMGSILSTLANSNVAGTIKRTVVTLSRKAERNAVIMMSITNSLQGSPFATS